MTDFALFALAVIGNGGLLTLAVNWLFGQNISHNVLDKLRLLAGALLIVNPLLLAYLTRFEIVELFSSVLVNPWHYLLRGYFVACWLAAVVAIPVATVARLLRRPPADQLSHRGTVVDFARELGAPPLGKSKRRALAKLPGNQCFQVEFSAYEFRRPGLPKALDGLTILHLSDLHFYDTPTRAWYEALIARCQADGTADVVAVTGDIVDGLPQHEWVAPVLGKLKWNLAAFAILGNHDTWYQPDQLRRRLSSLGFAVLGNDWRSVNLRGTPVTVIGHEGPWVSPPPDITGCPPDNFRLLLSHTPDNLAWAARHRVGLMLAGHVHGGQIVLPFFGPLFVPSKYSRRYDAGTFARGPTLMHVTRGLAGKEPLRYGARPQVSRITLRRSDA